MKSVYIHIPFCRSLCNYCDFCKLYYNQKDVDRYLKVLEEEIEKTYQGEEIKTIYIGGGTPSMLELDQLKYLFTILNIFDKRNIQEFTIECNIEDLTLDKLKLFKEAGVNRLSIGIQSFNPKILKVLGRNHSSKMIFDNINLAKKQGFTNINIDLIYGVSGETMAELQSDLDLFWQLDIPHVSFYSLIIEPHTKLYLESYPEIDDDLNAKMYDYLNQSLREHHYDHYEISNYAKDGYQSLHNLVYWHNEEYYGFGLGASSFIDGKRCDNTRSLNQYLAGNYCLNIDKLSMRKMMENEMILGLRLLKGVNKSHFYQKYGHEIAEIFNITQLLDTGLLVDDGDFLYIPEDKMFISNTVLLEFIE